MKIMEWIMLRVATWRLVVKFDTFILNFTRSKILSNTCQRGQLRNKKLYAFINCTRKQETNLCTYARDRRVGISENDDADNPDHADVKSAA